MANKSISYLEFKKAAIRNISVCEILLKTYSSENSNSQKQILCKTFYLGGYVIEFLYKFLLFNHLNLHITDDVYSYGDKEFQKKWKVHSFDQLNFLCQEKGLTFSTDIPYFGNKLLNKNVEKLFDAWDVQVRYSLNLSKNKVNLQYCDLTKYVATIKDINNKINSLYP